MSARNNNNYQQTALLTALHYFADNGPMFLRNFYDKSKRSVEKPREAGPAAYVFAAGEKRSGAQARLCGSCSCSTWNSAAWPRR